MVDKLKKKLKSRAGESIGETLVALIISALALVMLAGAMSAASVSVTRSRKKLDEYYKKSEEAVNMTGETAASGTITIQDNEGAITFEPFNIVYYRNGEFGKRAVFTYKLSE